jgi:GT2 family glycosyltransferase
MFPQVRFVELQTNRGFGCAANAGARASTGKVLIIMNYDVEVDPQWLQQLALAFQKDPSIGGCGCKVLFAEHRKVIDCVGGFDCDAYGSGLNPVGHSEIDVGQYDSIDTIFALPGLCMPIRREAFLKTGGFDEKYFLMAEDIDLSWRIVLCGYRITVNPLAIVYHVGRDSFKRERIGRSRIRFWVERNTLRTLLKNYQGRTLARVLPGFLSMIIAETIFFMMLGRIDWTVSDIRAISWNLSNFPDTLKARLKVKQFRRFDDGSIRPKMTRRNLRVEMFSRFVREGFKTI